MSDTPPDTPPATPKDALLKSPASDEEHGEAGYGTAAGDQPQAPQPLSELHSTLTRALLNIIQLTLCAASWEAAGNEFGDIDSTEEFLWRCLASGAADAGTATTLWLAEKIIDKCRGVEKHSWADIGRNAAIKLTCSTLIGAMWQPAANVGKWIGSFFGSGTAKAVGGISTTFAWNFGANWQLGKVDEAAPPAFTAAMAESLFFLEKYLAFPGSPYGNRDILYSSLLTAIGATVGEAGRALTSCFCKP